jgi:D-alanyl-D-alanine carboxypeptidase
MGRVVRLVGRRLPALVLTISIVGFLDGARSPLSAAVAVTEPRQQAAQQQAARPDLEQALEGFVRAGAPGIVAIVKDSRGTWRGASGLANLRTKTAMRPGVHFRIASVTKSFTATVVLQLVGEGKLQLDDPVERWLPGVVPNGANISVLQLLRHTSGIRDFDDPPGLMRPTEVIAGPLSKPPLFAPGAAWSYSSTNYILLGLIVESVTGSTFGKQLRQRILTPLRLRNTTFERNPTDVSMMRPYAHGYDLVSSSRRLDVTAFKGHWASGGIVSTVGDLARFYSALLGGRLLRKDILGRMLVTVPTANAPDDPNGPWGPSVRFGLGIRALRMACGMTAWGHWGDLSGYHTAVLSTKNGSRVAILAVNTSGAWIYSNAAGRWLDMAAERAACGRG